MPSGSIPLNLLGLAKYTKSIYAIIERLSFFVQLRITVILFFRYHTANIQKIIYVA